VTLPSLYPILDADAAARHESTVSALARACFDGGARFVQVRAKRAAAGALLAALDEIVARAAAVGALVVVNDRADLARLADAGGVHVGQDDLPPDAVRRVVGPGVLVGLSTHTRDQIDRALDAPIDYLAVGPVFGTTTKDTGYEPVGLPLVEYAAGRVAATRAGALPIVAIGGITLDRARAVIDAGAASLAVIGDLFAGGDPLARTREWIAALSPSAGVGLFGVD
jgi:thiamine-phosphate pyrophosphorylase